MGRSYKNELNHEYGTWLVIKYNAQRYKPNGAVVWTVKCRKCGHIKTYRGESLRFNNFGKCPNCGRRD